jgi:hypothetical protein
MALCSSVLLAVVPPAQAQSIDTGDLEDLLPPVHFRRAQPAPAGEPGAGNPYGVKRRLDPFDALEDEERKPSAASATGGLIICEAGCDGPSGAVVHHPKKQASANGLR